MPKKSKKPTGGLGKTLIKDHKSAGLVKTDGWLHTSELSDGYDWGRLNLNSVTDENHLDEFLRTAELAGTEFTAEKLQISVVGDSTGSYTGLPSVEAKKDIEKAQLEHRQLLSIPRRPAWNSSTTPEELESREKESFLEWRRHLATVQENDKLTLTPFERNLEFWRQLWRVIERSDIVVQIVDGRNPLLFRCEDLEKYVKEVDSSKINMILMSKCDLLNPEQRAAWLEYFKSQDIPVAFWSSKIADTKNGSDGEIQEKNDGADTEDDESDHEMEGSDHDAEGSDHYVVESDHDVVGSDHDMEGSDHDMEGSDHDSEVSVHEAEIDPKESSGQEADPSVAEGDQEMKQIDSNVNNDKGFDVEETTVIESSMSGLPGLTNSEHSIDEEDVRSKVNCTNADESSVFSCEELLKFFRELYPQTSKDHPLTIGLVGYPNVGKSSTINSLLRTKKVPVSATPGRTKHFQTLFVDEDILLCDCPGLVFPNFISTKADMVCNGILPIDQMRDHVPPISLICSRIPRSVLEQSYGVMIPPPREGEDPLRPPYAYELLAAYGYARGFMTTHGVPDQARSARYILKDYVNGTKLLYCEPPPGVDPTTFNSQLQVIATEHQEKKSPTEPMKPSTSNFDTEFFQQTSSVVHSKVITGTSGTGATHSKNTSLVEKPWKKHNNRHRKEKTRRIVGKTNKSSPYDFY